jgi:hypothetical protein
MQLEARERKEKIKMAGSTLVNARKYGDQTKFFFFLLTPREKKKKG